MSQRLTYDEQTLKIKELERNEKIHKAKIEQLDLAIKATEDGIWDFDPRSGRIYFSDKWLSMLGYSPGDLPYTYETWATLLHPDDRPDAESTLKKFLENPDILFSIELRMRTKNQDWRWIHSRGKAFEKDSKGKISRMIGTHTDITDRKKLEDSFRLSRFIIDKASIGIFWTGQDAKIAYANEHACDGLGYSHDELCHMSIPDIDPNVTETSWCNHWRNVCENKVLRFEGIHRRKNGNTFPVEITANLVEFHGKLYSVSFVHDITARKTWEDTLRLTQFSQEKAPIGIYRVGADGRILDGNELAVQSLGYTKEELTSMTISDIDPSVTMGNWGEVWKRLEQGGIDSFETIHKHKDGRQFPVSITSHLLNFDNQLFSFVYVQDITHRKRIEKALVQSQKMESIGTLAGGISHDFNNILSVIIGQAELIELFDTKETSPVRSRLNEILKAAERAKKLVNQILVFSRHSKVSNNPVDLIPLAKEVIKFIRASTPSNIIIQSEIVKKKLVVLSDPSRMHQIFLNLCTNAVQAMEDSGGVLDIMLKSIEFDETSVRHYPGLTPGTFVMVLISDTGPGIPKEIQEKIFEPYFSTKKEGEGTGLGLSVVQGIVKRQNGHISVYSEEGQGTNFRVFLPQIEAEEGILKENQAKPLEYGNESVLIVDDNDQLLKTTCDILTHLGYQVTAYTDPVDALKDFNVDPSKFDLVITDLTMPTLSGIALYRKFCILRHDLPVILCSGFGKGMSEQTAKEVGFKAFLFKPLETRLLASTIRSILDEQQ